MTPELWKQIERLYHAALQQDSRERAAFLNRECAGDNSLRDEVESLLAQEPKAGAFMGTPALLFAARELTSDPHPSLLGRKFGPYTLLSLLGAGGMGEVYRARDTRLDRIVAIKVLSEPLSSDPANRRRFEREAKAVAGLSHPHICPLFDIGTDHGTDFLVMEYLDGQTLKQVIGGRPMEPARIVELCIEIADALETAHQQGVVHRDVKPANIFVIRGAHAKLLDFGIAKIMTVPGGAAVDVASNADDSGGRTGMPVGTVAYMSPEQVRGELLDGRSDLFAFGLVAYEMATGHQAFSGSSGIVIDGILNWQPAPVRKLNPTVPVELERIIEKALAKDRRFRYQSASEMRADLQRVKHEINSGWQPPRVIAALRRLVSPARVVTVILGIVIAALLATSYGTLGLRARHVTTATPPLVDVSIPGISRLVVLPFENLTGQPGDDWLAGAFSDSLTLGLKNLRGVLVVNRERIIEVYHLQAVKEAGALDPEVLQRLSRLLNVHYYVHGSYQRIGGQIKVTARLAAVDSAAIRMQESVTDSFTNILRVEDTLARKFASTLEAGTATGVAFQETASLDAYKLFNEGQVAYTLRDLDSARQKLERAAAIDGRYAQAWALLSQTYSRLGAPMTLRGGSQAAYHEKALTTAKRASDLEPGLYDAHVALALAYRGFEDIGLWRIEAQKAIDINPLAAEGYALLADSYSAVAVWGCKRDRNPSLAEGYYRKAMQLDPRLRINLDAHLSWIGRLDDALRTVDNELVIVPNNTSSRRLRSQVLAFQNRVVESEDEVLRITDGGKNLSAADEWTLATIALQRSNIDEAAQRFRHVLALSPTSADELIVARSYVNADRFNLALPHLESAIEMDQTCAQFVADSVPFKSVVIDPAFRELLVKHGAHLDHKDWR